MKSNKSETTNIYTDGNRKDERIIGISLLIMTFAAFFAYGYVFSEIVILDNIRVTQDNIVTNISLYYAGIAGWGIIFITDLIVSVYLYRLLKISHQTLAFITASLRFIYTLILGIAIVFLFLRKPITFDSIWSYGLILFGLHLILLGYTMYTKTHMVKILSLLLILGGISYVVVHGLYSFAPRLMSITATIEAILMLPMAAGEIGFAIWLLVYPLFNTTKGFGGNA